MTVYDFAPDLDLSKEVAGSIFGVKGIEGSFRGKRDRRQ